MTAVTVRRPVACREVGEDAPAMSFRTQAIRLVVGLGALIVIVAVMPTDNPEAMQGFMTLGILLAGYFLPWIVAMNRRHHQKMAIGMLNLLLGWTVLGWIVALVWACTAVRSN